MEEQKLSCLANNPPPSYVLPWHGFNPRSHQVSPMGGDIVNNSKDQCFNQSVEHFLLIVSV
jgi:hypothetical protein